VSPSANPIRVLLVDDEEMFVAALTALLGYEDEIEIVGATNNGAQALELADATAPDVALVDLDLPVMDGFETTRRLVERRPALRVVVISGMSGDGMAARAADAGAAGYLFKGGLHTEIIDAILDRSEQPREAGA
jgi:DNA-binding NarL/FixJ family response regulator